MAHDVSTLERIMRDITNIRQGWSDKVKAVITEKNLALQCLQAATNREKEVVEREKKQTEKNLPVEG